jgi:hypothetical protein
VKGFGADKVVQTSSALRVAIEYRLTCVPFSFSIRLLSEAPAMHPEDLPFRVIRVNSEDEVIARAIAFETAVRLYPRDVIQYREGGRIIARSDPTLTS